MVLRAFSTVLISRASKPGRPGSPGLRGSPGRSPGAGGSRSGRSGIGSGPAACAGIDATAAPPGPLTRPAAARLIRNHTALAARAYVTPHADASWDGS